LTVEAPQVVECSRCGSPFTLAATNVRRARRLGLAHVCGDCRHPAKPEDPRRRERFRRWWLERHSLEEIRAWPPI
jgi:hypothetical protein